MSLRDELIVGEPSAAEVQKAYDEAGRYEFNGRRLESWTVRRHSVALQLRSRLMQGMNDENKSVENYLATGFYPHVFHDIVVCLYLLHLDKKQVVALETLDVIDALDQAYSWAESIPLTYGSAIFFEAAKVMGKILHSMHVSWFQVVKKEPDPNANGEKKIPATDVIDQPGSSRLVSEQSEPPDLMPNT